MKKLLLSTALGLLLAPTAGLQAQVLVSGYLANPAGTDSPYEYVQLVATQTINFAVTPYTVVVANNGTATSNGWVVGGALTYNFNITTGTVNAGSVFYIGGSGKLINGSGSTDISSANFLAVKTTGTAAGDNFGTANTAGVVGNGGTNADGIGVFVGLGSTLTAASVPVDAVFYGSAVGTAYPGAGQGGYTVPASDRYAGGIFGDANDTFTFSDPASAQFTRLTGTYDASSGSFTTARTSSLVTLTTTSQLSDISSGLTVVTVPEPSTWLGGLLVVGAFGFGVLRRLRRVA